MQVAELGAAEERLAEGDAGQSLGLLAMVPVCAGFVLVQRTGLFAKTTRLLNKVAAGRLEGAIGTSDRIDRAIRVMYRRRPEIIACFFWQLAGWIAGAGELWLALQFLGHPIDVADAVARQFRELEGDPEPIAFGGE